MSAAPEQLPRIDDAEKFRDAAESGETNVESRSETELNQDLADTAETLSEQTADIAASTEETRQKSFAGLKDKIGDSESADKFGEAIRQLETQESTELSEAKDSFQQEASVIIDDPETRQAMEDMEAGNEPVGSEDIVSEQLLEIQDVVDENVEWGSLTSNDETIKDQVDRQKKQEVFGKSESSPEEFDQAMQDMLQMDSEAVKEEQDFAANKALADQLLSDEDKMVLDSEAELLDKKNREEEAAKVLGPDRLAELEVEADQEDWERREALAAELLGGDRLAELEVEGEEEDWARREAEAAEILGPEKMAELEQEAEDADWERREVLAAELLADKPKAEQVIELKNVKRSPEKKNKPAVQAEEYTPAGGTRSGGGGAVYETRKTGKNTSETRKQRTGAVKDIKDIFKQLGGAVKDFFGGFKM